MLAVLGIKADRIWTKDIRALRTGRGVEVITADSEVIVVHSAGKRSIPIVLPRARASFVVCNDDEVEVARDHVDDILRAEVSHAFQVAPSGV